MNKIDLRHEVASMFGENHPATVAVSKAVINAFRAEWLPVRPRPVKVKAQRHQLLTLDYQGQVRDVFRQKMGQAYTNKIPAIKQVRTDSGFGLYEAKQYVEWLCEFGPEPEFLKTLPGYCPF